MGGTETEEGKGEGLYFHISCLKHFFTSRAPITRLQYASGNSNRPIPSIPGLLLEKLDFKLNPYSAFFSRREQSR